MVESGLGKSEKTNGAGEERWRREMKEKRAREGAREGMRGDAMERDGGVWLNSVEDELDKFVYGGMIVCVHLCCMAVGYDHAAGHGMVAEERG